MRPVEIAACEYQKEHNVYPLSLPNIIGAMLINGNSDIDDELVHETVSFPMYKLEETRECDDLARKRYVFTKMLGEDSRQSYWEGICEEDDETYDFIKEAWETMARNIDEENIDDWLESLNVYNLVFFTLEWIDPFWPWRMFTYRFCAFTETP